MGSVPAVFFFFNDTATTEIYTLSLHDALPICGSPSRGASSISAGSIRSGTKPTWRNSSNRRGETEASTRGGAVTTRSPSQMQHADQCEQAPRGIEVDLDLIGEPLHQQRGALVVQQAATHVDRLDLREARTADRLVVAFAHHEVISEERRVGKEC